MSDLLFFTGFEGCTGDTDLRQLFQQIGGGATWRPTLNTTGGYLGSKGMQCHSTYNSWAQHFIPSTESELYVGGHFWLTGTSSPTFYALYINGATNIQFFYPGFHTLRITCSGFSEDFVVHFPPQVYFHIEAYINSSTGTLKIKLDGIEILNQSGLNLGTGCYGALYQWHRYDNLWMHRSRSLGQAISYLALPYEEGHYAQQAYNYYPHNYNDQNELLVPSIQTNNSDTAYIFASHIDAKYTVKHFVEDTHTVKAFAIQRINKHLSTSVNKLSRKDLVRFNSIDYSGEAIVIPTSYYNHSLVNRSYGDLASDDTELTREKFNATEFGIKLVEQE